MGPRAPQGSNEVSVGPPHGTGHTSCLCVSINLSLSTSGTAPAPGPQLTPTSLSHTSEERHSPCLGPSVQLATSAQQTANYPAYIPLGSLPSGSFPGHRLPSKQAIQFEPQSFLPVSCLRSYLGQYLISLGLQLLLQLTQLPGHGGHHLRVMEYGDCQVDKVSSAQAWG